MVAAAGCARLGTVSFEVVFCVGAEGVKSKIPKVPVRSVTVCGFCAGAISFAGVLLIWFSVGLGVASLKNEKDISSNSNK